MSGADHTFMTDFLTHVSNTMPPEGYYSIQTNITHSESVFSVSQDGLESCIILRGSQLLVKVRHILLMNIESSSEKLQLSCQYSSTTLDMTSMCLWAAQACMCVLHTAYISDDTRQSVCSTYNLTWTRRRGPRWLQAPAWDCYCCCFFTCLCLDQW